VMLFACPWQGWVIGKTLRSRSVQAAQQDFSATMSPASDAPIADHAVHYASSYGWRVFPVPLGTKKSHKSAARSGGRAWGQTTDVEEITQDFQRWPDANVGIVCGAGSKIFVVETDTAEGHGDGVDGAATLSKLENEHGALPATLEAMSPSGSVHRYFNHPGFYVINSESVIGDGIDVRGDGGMVLGPPSVKPDKGVYTWRNELPVADAPQWLLDRVAKPEKPVAAAAVDERSITERALATISRPASSAPPTTFKAMASQPYVDAVLSGEYNAVASVPSEGFQNNQLNISSMKLGKRVAAGLVSEQEVIDIMMQACAANGLLDETGHDACMATIESGLKFGMTQPKGIPEQKPDNVLPFPGGAAPDATSERSKPTSGLTLTYFDDVEKFKQKTWLIKNAIAAGDTSMWIAPPRLKSALMADLAIHMASGTDWRGYPSKETCGVVYFALERGDLVKRRLAAHKQRDELAGLPIVVAVGTLNLMDSKCVDIIVATIGEAEEKFGCQVRFIVIDTLPKAIAEGGGDENQAKDMGKALAHVGLVKGLTGVHVAMVAHSGKDETKGARGSNSQVGDVDVLVRISGEGSIKIATVTKANDQEEGVLTKFKAEIAVLGVDEDGDDITTAIISTDPCGASSTGKPTKAEKAAMKPVERRAKEFLVQAINEVGKKPPPSDRIPHSVERAVPIDVWRDYCDRGGGLTASQADDAARKAFYRAWNGLKDSQRIGIWDELVWIAYD
jgi:hypothetical protein